MDNRRSVHQDNESNVLKYRFALENDGIEIFKNGNGKVSRSLRSLDARGRDLASAIHWAVSDDLGKRTYFQIGNGHQAKLKVTKVTYKDQGVFRCRVDFINSPTRNFRVNLTLVGEYEISLLPPLFPINGRTRSRFQRSHPGL